MGSKAGSAVVCILCALLRLMQAIEVNSLLEEPEFYYPGIIISEDGTMATVGEPEPNPDYILEGSPKRAFYNFLMDFMPGGQALQIAEHAVDNLVKICLYDMGWLASKRIIPTLPFLLCRLFSFHNERDWIAVHPFITGYYTPMGVYF